MKCHAWIMVKRAKNGRKYKRIVGHAYPPREGTLDFSYRKPETMKGTGAKLCGGTIKVTVNVTPGDDCCCGRGEPAELEVTYRCESCKQLYHGTDMPIYDEDIAAVIQEWLDQKPNPVFGLKHE